MAVTRTAVVKNLEETFVSIVRANANTVVSARSVGQRVTILTATTLQAVITAVRGAGHAPGAVASYAVALTAINGATVLTIGGNTATFVLGDPPGTAIPFSANVDPAATCTVTSGVAGDMFAIVQQPPAYASNLIGFVTAKSFEPDDLRRDIRDRGVLQHKKIMAMQGGVLTLTAKYENAKAGLSQYVDQHIIIVAERDDDRQGTVTEKEIFYGAYINAIPPPNETEGDTDTDVSIAVRVEMIAVVGESI